MSNVDTTKYTVYSDLEGHKTQSGGTITPEICVPIQRPDIMILNKVVKTIQLFELRCPTEEDIEKRNVDKVNRYSHFLRDCSGYKCTLTCFEISSKGFVNPRNHTPLNTLQKCKTVII